MADVFETLDYWTAGPLDHWTAGPLDHWTTGLLDHWTAGRAAGPLDYLFCLSPILRLSLNLMPDAKFRRPIGLLYSARARVFEIGAKYFGLMQLGGVGCRGKEGG